MQNQVYYNTSENLSDAFMGNEISGMQMLFYDKHALEKILFF